MRTANQLCTVYGPRLTGSPQLTEASGWVMTQLREWGMNNIHKESWQFGRGWSMQTFWINAVQPVPFQVLAYPEAWSPGTNGNILADAVIFDAHDPSDFEKYRGTLAGKIVLEETVKTIAPRFKPLATRLGDDELLGYANAPAPEESHGMQLPDWLLAQFKRDRKVYNFLIEEKPAAIFFRGQVGGDRGIVFPDAALTYTSDTTTPDWFMNVSPSYSLSAGPMVPQVLVSVEHYNRLYRLAKMGFPVKIEMQLDVKFHEKDSLAYNIIAEIPGEDPGLKQEVVMLGAHLDSWHGGTGATDNAAGCAVMMDVMRILRSVFNETGTKPRRTIRLALWSGEEQGLKGSIAYVNQHFAELEGKSYNLKRKKILKEHESLSAYYNLDFGTGKIRGVYLQGNLAVLPIFRKWLEPFQEYGASTLSPGGLGGGSGSDHMPFDVAGLPGFMFIQDLIEYRTLTHHSVMDEYDHLVEKDLQQSAEIIVAFVYQTAQRDQRLPRKND